MLHVGDNHRIYWECCGNPEGAPVLYVHGGRLRMYAGGARRLFDPRTYRAVLFDQRGCGRSSPLASDPQADLRSNTTAHLIEDIEQLRMHLGIETWVLLGVSWGTTLALAYAQKHPDRVTGAVLALVTTTSSREVHWITDGVGRIFPKQWERFRNAVSPELSELPLVSAYAAMLFDPDPHVCDRAALAWCAWEDAHVSLAPNGRPNPRFQDPRFRLQFARIVTHYWKQAAFLDDGQLVRDAGVLDGIPGVLINGRYDVSTPLESAWHLSRAWATAELRIVDDAGHGGGSLPSAMIEALGRISSGIA